MHSLYCRTYTLCHWKSMSVQSQICLWGQGTLHMQQNLRGKRPTIMHGIAGRSLEDRATAGFPLTKNYLWLGAPSVILVHLAPVSSFPGPSSIPAQDPARLPSRRLRSLVYAANLGTVHCWTRHVKVGNTFPRVKHRKSEPWQTLVSQARPSAALIAFSMQRDRPLRNGMKGSDLRD